MPVPSIATQTLRPLDRQTPRAPKGNWLRPREKACWWNRARKEAMPCSINVGATCPYCGAEMYLTEWKILDLTGVSVRPVECAACRRRMHVVLEDFLPKGTEAL